MKLVLLARIKKASEDDPILLFFKLRSEFSVVNYHRVNDKWWIRPTEDDDPAIVLYFGSDGDPYNLERLVNQAVRGF